MSDKKHRLKISAYIFGFVLSLYLTLIAYWLTVHDMFEPTTFMVAIMTLALLQFSIQVIFFLHIGEESKPRWNLTTFGFMLLVVAIVVLGSLWIMDNLSYHHGAQDKATPEQIDREIVEDEAIEIQP